MALDEAPIGGKLALLEDALLEDALLEDTLLEDTLVEDTSIGELWGYEGGQRSRPRSGGGEGKRRSGSSNP